MGNRRRDSHRERVGPARVHAPQDGVTERGKALPFMIVTERQNNRYSRCSRGSGAGEGDPRDNPNTTPGPGARVPGVVGLDAGGGVGLDAGGGVALVVPPTGAIRAVAWRRDVVSLSRREIGCRAVEQLRLGPTLLPRGVQIWLDANGPTTGRPINPRAGAVVIATLPPGCGPARVLRGMFIGAVLLCAGPDSEGTSLALTPQEADVLSWATTTLERPPARRGLRGGRRARRR